MISTKIEVSQANLSLLNSLMRNKTPHEIIEWAINYSEKAVVTTNFRPYEAAILHACVSIKENIDVIWCDTGYNTPNTYRCAHDTIRQLKLNIDLYVPNQSAAYRDVYLGIPAIESKEHLVFTEEVKLEPFKRAMKKHQPDVWFTNIRKGQTALRDSLDILSLTKDGVLKVSPFYYYLDEELDVYMNKYQLLNEFNYYDPTKGLANRECGLHIN